MVTKPYTMSHHGSLILGKSSDLALRFTALPLLYPVTRAILVSLLLFRYVRSDPGSVQTLELAPPFVWNTIPLHELFLHFPQIFVQMTPN